jgi:ArsR family transcriptional regulator, virulence genes transcriptional regulator
LSWDRVTIIPMKTSTAIDPGEMAKAAAQASELMKTLGHKDRLMVLCHLVEGEKSVGELAQLLNIPQSPLSQHLARMRQESLVRTRREAQTIYYSIDSPEAEQIIQVIHDIFCP